jgi:hypothetical protein
LMRVNQPPARWAGGLAGDTLRRVDGGCSRRAVRVLARGMAAARTGFPATNSPMPRKRRDRLPGAALNPLAWPEEGSPEDRHQRRQQRQAAQQHHRDRDGDRGTQRQKRSNVAKIMTAVAAITVAALEVMAAPTCTRASSSAARGARPRPSISR